MLTKPSNGSLTVLDYKPQLDGLRFVAVFVVIFYHYSPSVQNLTRIIDSSILLAFFFVLSSYLITRILLRSKEKGVEAGFAKYKIAGVFLIRRTLRIFPAYYLYLLIIFFFPIGGKYLREHLEMFFFYLANFQIYQDQQWNELTAHLWTLAIEEQFYLVWPWLILFTPRKHLTKLLFLIVFIGTGSRLLLYGLIESPESQTVTIQVLTPACLDSFGLGALLAYQHRKGVRYNPVVKKVLIIVSILWLAAIAFNFMEAVLALGSLLIALFAMVIIEGAVNGYKNRLGKFLENKTVLYLAKISYGIYLYHIFSAFILWKLLIRIRYYSAQYLNLNISAAVDLVANPWVYFSLSLLLTILLAAASWYFIESPINNLKRFFTYSSSDTSSPDISSKPKEKQLVNQ